jgi:transposase
LWGARGFAKPRRSRPTSRSVQSRSHGSGLGAIRWIVERTFAWLYNLRRLRFRYERSGELHTAFLTLGATVICQRLLPWFADGTPEFSDNL